jgi:hypothetical protein
VKEVVPIFPATAGPIIILVIVGVILLGILVILGVFAYASHYAKFEISPAGLTIRGDFYGRHIPAAALLLEEAKAVDLNVNKELSLKWRTNGAGFPGYCSGWFQLGNDSKGLVFVTDRRRVVYLPTKEGYAVLLSVAEPEQFLGNLRQMVKDGV